MPRIDDNKAGLGVQYQSSEILNTLMKVQSFARHTIENADSREIRTGFRQPFFQKLSPVFRTDEEDIARRRGFVYLIPGEQFSSAEAGGDAAAKHGFACTAFRHEHAVISDGDVRMPDKAGVVLPKFLCAFGKKTRRAALREPDRRLTAELCDCPDGVIDSEPGA